MYSVVPVPFSPLNNCIARSRVIPSALFDSILRITSLALIPASNAGVPSMGEIIVSFSSLIPTTIPIPPKLPLVSTKN